MTSSHKRQYVDTENGQVHMRIWSALGDNVMPPIICLPPAPFSGAAYETLAPHLVGDATVIAIDYPGYGMSDAIPGAPSITAYANATLSVLDEFANNRAPTLLGFHTGCLVGVESAILAPERVGRLLLIDVPYFDPVRRHAIRDELNANTELTKELSMLDQDWTAYVTNRLDNVPLNRAYQLFVDQATASERRTAAFHAALKYPCELQFPRVSCRVDVLATKAGLYQESHNAAGLMPTSYLTDATDITVSVLEQQAANTASIISRLLNAPDE